MRFRKLKHSLIYSPNVAGKIDTEDSDFFAIQERIIKMRYFTNIAGKSFEISVFVVATVGMCCRI